jgi:hypothetical protein
LLSSVEDHLDVVLIAVAIFVIVLWILFLDPSVFWVFRCNSRGWVDAVCCQGPEL